MLTATQIASMLEGDVVMGSDDPTDRRRPRGPQHLPGDAVPPLWLLAREACGKAAAKRWRPIHVAWNLFVSRGYMLEALWRTLTTTVYFLSHALHATPPPARGTTPT